MTNDKEYLKELHSVYRKVRPFADMPYLEEKKYIDPNVLTMPKELKDRGLDNISRDDLAEALEKIDPDIAKSLLNSTMSSFEKELLSQSEDSTFYSQSQNIISKIDIVDRLKNELVNNPEYEDFDFSKHIDKEKNVDLVGVLKGINDFQMDKLQNKFPHVSSNKNKDINKFVATENITKLFAITGNCGLENLQQNMLADKINNGERSVQKNKRRKGLSQKNDY